MRVIGPEVFDRFKAGREGTLWYYRRLSEVFVERLGERHPVVLELTASAGAMDNESPP